MKKFTAICIALAILAGCSTDLSDPRTQSLMAMPSPKHYAERRVARELTARCTRYAFNGDLADAMSRARADAGLQTSLQVQGALELESDIKRRSIAARYGSDWNTLDACVALDGENASGTAMSVLTRRTG